MMEFELSRDADGKPFHVYTNDGFMQISRNYDPEQDGWMDDQLDPRDFDAIRAGRQMESLVHEVNALRRENWELRKSERRWMKATGIFGETAAA